MIDKLRKSGKIKVADEVCYDFNQNTIREQRRGRLAFGISYQHPLAPSFFLEVIMEEMKRFCKGCQTLKEGKDFYWRKARGKISPQNCCKVCFKKRYRHKEWVKRYNHILERCKSEGIYGRRGIKNYLKIKDIKKYGLEIKPIF